MEVRSFYRWWLDLEEEYWGGDSKLLRVHLPHMLAAGDFKLGGVVRSGDGREVGTLHRVLVDRETFAPRAIVVKEHFTFGGHLLAPGSLLLTDDLVVPIDAVVSASLTTSDVRHLPPYLSYRATGEGVPDLAREGIAIWLGGLEIPPITEFATKESADIEIAQGENVMLGKSGRKLGVVRSVLVEGGQLVGVVLHPEGLFKHDVVLPVRFLTRSDDLALFAQLEPDDLAHLEAFRTES
jgi:hypothetical protein